MKTTCLLVSIFLVAVAGCGGDDGASDSGSGAADTSATVKDEKTGGTRTGDAEGETGGATRKGTAVLLGDSQFGRILFDSKQQAIYIFERDEENKSDCYGDCAEAWPPVFTKGKPRGSKGVDRSLLGTTKRRDGKLQVTYAGKPLYYYAHEGPGEVKCHNVNLNGGFWWVVGPNGKRRP